MDKGILELLPKAEDFPGWNESESRVLRSVQEMSDYMDGGAELYFAYNFVQLGLKKIVNKDEVEIVIELYEMEDKDCAYGVMSFDLYGKRIDVGTIGIYESGLLRFWKGKYYCRIQMWKGFEENEDIIFDTGQIIEKSIGDTEDKIPELVQLLPKEGLEEKSIHYFFHITPLNNFYYFSNENIFNIGENASGVIANYDFEDYGTFLLMTIKYEDEKDGFEAYRRFSKLHLNKEIDSKDDIADFRVIKEVESSGFLGIDFKEKYLVLILEGKSKEICSHYLDKIFDKISNKE